MNTIEAIYFAYYSLPILAIVVAFAILVGATRPR